MKEIIEKLGTQVQFPVKYYENNLIFTYENECWAYYEMPGFVYDFLSEDEKKQRFFKLNTFFSQIASETHLLILPKFESIKEIHEHFKEKITGTLTEAAIKHTDRSALEVEKKIGSEASDFHFYIGIKLPQLENTNMKDFFSGGLKAWWRELLESTNLDAADIPESNMVRYKNLEKTFFTRIENWFKVERINEDEMQFLLRRNFYRGITNPPIFKGIKPKVKHSYNKQQKKVIKPIERDILRMTEGLVDESNGRTIKLTQNIDGQEKTGHAAFLCMSVLPELEWPGDEWLYVLQNLAFPAEASIRFTPIEHGEALRKVNRQQAHIKDQIDHAEENGNDVDLNHIEGNQEAAELKAYLTSARVPLIEASISFCVSAESEEELFTRVKSFMDEYKEMGIHLEQPFGDQWPLFNEFIPGSTHYVKDYIHYTETWTMAGSLFGATKQIGDGKGFYLGSQGVLNKPVYLDPSLAAKNVEYAKTRSLSAAFIGPVGGGKSFTSNLVTYLSVLGGAKALVIDPKGERGNWVNDLEEIKEEINIITLTSDDENAGKLDPFNVCKNEKEAQALAVEIITFLLGIDPADERFPVVTEAVEMAAKTKPCMLEVVRQLQESEDPEFKRVGRHLNSFCRLRFSSLLFGNGDIKKPISLETALNVLQIQNLRLPAASKPIEKYSTIERLSMAMMLPIGEFAHSFIKSDRRIFKVCLFDEAWFLTQTDIGRELVERLAREGRSQNAGVYLSTQNSLDLLDEKIRSNIGMKFAFQNNDAKDIVNTLKFFGLQDTDENITTIQNLNPRKGECLMQDIYGRTSVVRVDYLFDGLFKAFDTRPPEKEEKLNEYEHLQEPKHEQKQLHEKKYEPVGL